MSWKTHIVEINKRLCKACYCIRIMKSKSYNKKTCLIVFHSIFMSVLSYGIIFWGFSSIWKSCFILQKYAIRILNNLNYRDSCKPHFISMQILTLPSLYIYQCVLYMFNLTKVISNGRLPIPEVRVPSFYYPLTLHTNFIQAVILCVQNYTISYH